MVQFDYSSIDNPGYEPARRLTHIEFSNTLRDLLGLDLNLVADFPIDLSGKSGFDNSANTLFLQPILMERYLSAIDKAVEAVLPLNKNPSENSPVFVVWPSEKEEESKAASKIINRFLLRAFRRPPTELEINQVWTVYYRSREKKESFAMGLRHALGAA